MKWFKQQIGGKKGFTLVEIIVVLVVLAILAAFIIPTMLGFVADAKGKAYIAEAREVYVAAQAVATEYITTTDITDTNVVTGAASAHGNSSWGTGLAVSVSSFEVQYRQTHFLTSQSPEYNTPQINASHQMYAFISKDLPIANISSIQPLSSSGFSVPKPTNNQAAWIVTVGGVSDTYRGNSDSTRTGKITKVVYFRNGYKVTIEGNNSTVERY
ncbi:prepilin-type N-terminal cleavage/methylation domain-containing protein [Acetobacterium wieringae]|uniref:Prepilin-type N-terminal cleavage/methylation domain-containing protein n=1 Tax=Acetobacterium wieringae TaxID=52694 RepID=A0A1F2PFP3_9FIRM|nr:prepilin-type N-terminal cleavage/methylation domain-containing protein [Acetobacterium wieringae]OFV70167.1 hypothetical protein ACWI_23720 [Acetobacterium wieringae]